MPIAELKKMATPREVLLFVGAMLALVFVFFSFIYKPNGEKITQQKDRIKGIESEMITLKKDITALKQKNEAKQVQRAQSNNPKIQILKNDVKPDVLKTSELIKKISSDDFLGDMVIISLALQPSVESTGYVKKSFLLKVRGTFDEIISFLDKLDKLPALVSVDNLDLKQDDIIKGEMNLEAGITFYEVEGIHAAALN